SDLDQPVVTRYVGPGFGLGFGLGFGPSIGFVNYGATRLLATAIAALKRVLTRTFIVTPRSHCLCTTFHHPALFHPASGATTAQSRAGRLAARARPYCHSAHRASGHCGPALRP